MIAAPAGSREPPWVGYGQDTPETGNGGEVLGLR
jgi:hypothetical protein